MMNIPNKTKDNMKAREDFKKMDMRKDLHIQTREHDGKEVMQPAIFSMNAKVKTSLFRFAKKS